MHVLGAKLLFGAKLLSPEKIYFNNPVKSTVDGTVSMLLGWWCHF